MWQRRRLAEATATTAVVDEAPASSATTEPAPTVPETTAPPTTVPEPACPEPVPNDASQPAGIVAPLDSAAGEYLEGVAVDQSGNVFASLIRSGTILKFAPGSAEYDVFGEIPGWEDVGTGFLGLAVDDIGNVYGAAESGEWSGVWKFDCRTGAATRLDGTEAIAYANALAFDDQGDLYISDTWSNGDTAAPLGAVWRVSADGSVEKWMENDTLGGTGAFGLSTPTGANGIAVKDRTVYVANVERMAIFAIPILDDGSAGEISTVVEGGIIPDGLALDADGRFYVADVGGSAIKRVGLDGTIEVLAEGAPAGLDLPASIAFGIGGTELTIYAANLANVEAFSTGVGPALVAIDVDTAGQLPPRRRTPIVLARRARPPPAQRGPCQGVVRRARRRCDIMWTNRGASGLGEGDTAGVTEYRLLGPVDVRRDGESLDVGARQRSLLALLLIEANRVVSADRIIDELWGDDAGRDRHNALWVVISRLRSVLEPNRAKRSDGTVLVTRPPGYVLVVDPRQIDAHRFESLAREGRELLDTDPGAASVVLSEALALWRGRALEEFTYETFAEAEIARLEEVRLAAVGDRVEADLRSGRHRELVAELDGLVRQHPSHERFTALFMLALYRSGRQSDALRAFADRRAYLAEELGLEPSAGLAELEYQILTDDPRLQLAASAPTTGRADESLFVRGYELRERIGSGVTGEVFNVFQPAVGREVAIKVIRQDLADDPEFIRRFEAEARLVAQLEHPSIVPVYDYWREPGRAYLVMRRFERGNLHDTLRHGPLDPAAAARIVEQLGTALTVAHRQGIAHGDLTPGNVLIDRDGNAYLADFGMSGWVDSPDVDGTWADAETSATSDIRALATLADQLVGASVSDSPAAGVIARARDSDQSYPDVATFVSDLIEAWGEASSLTDAELPNPYRGLRAFGEDDAGCFFGRERVVERLLARLGYGGPKGRFVVVVGPSGSGKSSVVRAGLLPALRHRAIPGSDDWFIVTMTPGREPFDALADGLRAVAVDPPDDLADRLRTDGISRTATSVAPDETAQIAIVIDQLEELFSLTRPDVAAAFMTAVTESATARHSTVKVIATLRADFYDQPLGHPEFGELVRLGTEVITPMNPHELERTITGPADSVGVTVDPGVVAAIASDMSGQSGALPLMQYALTELFDQRAGSTITVDAYREIGGVAGHSRCGPTRSTTGSTGTSRPVPDTPSCDSSRSVTDRPTRAVAPSSARSWPQPVPT